MEQCSCCQQREPESESGLTQNEQSEAVEQGTDVGQDPHQHGKLGKDKQD